MGTKWRYPSRLHGHGLLGLPRHKSTWFVSSQSSVTFMRLDVRSFMVFLAGCINEIKKSSIRIEIKTKNGLEQVELYYYFHDNIQLDINILDNFKMKFRRATSSCLSKFFNLSIQTANQPLTYFYFRICFYELNILKSVLYLGYNKKTEQEFHY